MDPLTAVFALAPKLIGLATATHKALNTGGLDADDAKALKALTEFSGALVKTWQSAGQSGPDLQVLARYSALVGTAFMAAFHAQDATWGRDGDRKADIKACLTTGQETPIDGGAWAAQSMLLAGPVASPVYQRLWRLFLDAEHVRAADRVAFERLFRLAWAQLLRTAGGQIVRDAMIGAPAERARLIRRLIADDLVSWRGNHVFGNQRRVAGETPLPLAQMYVEPKLEEIRQPVRAAIDDWLRDGEHPIAAVTAPFGRGKSLTARMLAADMAERWLAEGPSARFPVFVPCATRLDASDLLMSVAEAVQDQLYSAYKHELDVDAPGVGWPKDQATLLVILDGLDEVALTPDAVERLLKAMRGKRGTARFIIFTRPATLPKGIKGIHRLPLANFDEVQVQAWLGNWNRLNHTRVADGTHVDSAAIAARGLSDLTNVPILLYMIARTWPELPDRPLEQIEVYEKFFDVLAVTKLKLDEHQTVQQAAEQMLTALRQRQRLDRQHTAKDALLWLLGRLAWEHARYAFRGEVLDRFAVKTVLRDELKVRQELDVILRGLMLVMQAADGSDTAEVNFSHRSFQEFLIARHWRNELLQDRPDERALMGARLIADASDDSKTEAFLLALLRQDPACERVAQWAEACFRDTRLGRHDAEACTDPVRDERCYLREAAIALRCQLNEAPLVIERAEALRSLAGQVWMQGSFLRLHAPRMRAQNLLLYRLVLNWRADLGGADLGGAHLVRANLGGAHLVGANLAWAHLGGVDLIEANLAGADLVEANLAGADLRRADLGIGTDNPVKNLHLAHNLDQARLPEGWEQLIPDPQT